MTEVAPSVAAFAALLQSMVEEAPPRFPAQPPNGSALRFERTFPHSDRVYTYLALRAGEVWYLTGIREDPISWEHLVELIGNSPCHLVTGYAEIPLLAGDPREEIKDPAEWFRAVYLESGDATSTIQGKP
jgi:hypothetical protein